LGNHCFKEYFNAPAFNHGNVNAAPNILFNNQSRSSRSKLLFLIYYTIYQQSRFDLSAFKILTFNILCQLDILLPTIGAMMKTSHMPFVTSNNPRPGASEMNDIKMPLSYVTFSPPRTIGYADR
jgi:hypothetical protein